jgi:hypothetical protein
MSELMQGGGVVAPHALERRGRRECDVVLGRDLACHVSTHTDICQGRCDKATRRVLGDDCFGQVFFVAEAEGDTPPV